jgi:hypothetical protein
MSLNFNQKSQIKSILKKTLQTKFKNYKPETSYMPYQILEDLENLNKLYLSGWQLF